MESKTTAPETQFPRGLNSLLDSARPLVFVGLLFMGVLGLIINHQFQSQKIAVSWLLVSVLGLLAHWQWGLIRPTTVQLRLTLSCLSSLLLCWLFYQMQSAQSLYLILILTNILIAGLQDGPHQSTVTALFSSVTFSAVIILSPSFSHFQDLLSIGLFNFSALLTAALSGLYFEKLTETQAAFDRSQDLLLDLNSRHRILIEELPLGVLVFNDEGQVIEQNPLFDKKFKPVLHLPDLFAKAAGTSGRPFSLRVETAQSPMDLSFRSRILSFSNKKYWIVLVEDVTETRRLEEDLKQKEKMAAIGTLAAGIAHEIRNPLAGMSGSVELLSLKPNTEEDQKLFKIILREIDRLNRLISEFLDFSRPTQSYTDRISLNQALNSVLGLVESAKEKPEGLKVSTNFESEFLVLGSSDKLRQALLNIVINSLQAMKGVSHPELFLSVRSGPQPQSADVRIRDNGCGMNEATRVKMFEPFHTTKPKGTGLGLAITHKILEAHKVQIHVSSEVGRGTEFQMIFPCV